MDYFKNSIICYDGALNSYFLHSKIYFMFVFNIMDIQITNTRRKILNHVVCSILVECGYDTCEKQALEVLTEMLQSCKDINFKIFLTS